jgi:hypothetical protein
MRRFALFLLLAACLTAQSTPEVEITAEPHHHLVFSNDQVRVFNVEIPPHSDTLLHCHRHDYIYITLGDSEVVNAVQGKAPVTVKLQDGQTGFLSGNYAHVARNLSAQPFRNVTVEILHDEKRRHSLAHWDPARPEDDRGLDILQGGTREILFVKDGVRASEFELQPNAAIPSHPHSGPLLLIAINELDLYTSDPRTHGPPEPDPAPPTHFNSGKSLWLPHGFGRPLTNAGHTVAKFVTLEFH